MMMPVALRRLQLAFVATIALIALLCAGSVLTFDRATRAQAHYAAMLNLAAHQRTGAQRIAYLAHAVAHPEIPDPLQRSGLAAAIEAMATQHAALVADARQGRPLGSAIFDGASGGLDGEVQRYLSLARQIHANPGDQRSLAQLEAASERLIARLDQVAGVYEAEIGAQGERLRWMALASPGLIGLALAGVGLLVFRPLVARLSRETSDMALLALVASKTGTAVLISDAAGRTEWVNQAFVDTTGYDLDDLRGRRPGELLRGAGTDTAAARSFDTALETGEPISGALLNYRKDGSPFWIELSVSPVYSPSGRLEHYVTVQNDISGRVRAEAELREALALNQAILDSAGYLIIATGPDGTITRFNRAAERALGYRAAEVIGKLSAQQFYLGEEVEALIAQRRMMLDDDTSSQFRIMHWLADAGGLDEREWTLVRKDGSSFPAHVALSALRDRSGGVIGYVGVGSDISERRAIDRMKREFVAVVSHELRTPLTSIRGALGLLAGGAAGALPARAGTMIEIAHRNSERLMRLINDILDVERIEAGHMRFELMPTALIPLVEQSIEANRAYAAELGVRLAFDPDPDQAVVSADPDRMIQVFTNLLSNAAKFSPAGALVTVRVEQIGDWARVSVADCGPGVPAEFGPRIFERFAQADGSNTRARGGSGLGLNIARSIVERHGGQIGYTSTPGAGSVFYVDLPALAPEPRPHSAMPRLLPGPTRLAARPAPADRRSAQ